VHVVGPDADGVAKLRAAGCAMVWCPSSNCFLFGRTAPASLLADGIDVLLGTDSRLTGAGDLLDELRFAHHLKLISDERLENAVGKTAARRLGISPPSLDLANCAVFRKPLLESAADDVAVVVAAGALRVLDPALIPAGLTHGRVVRHGHLRRWINENVPF
jgi:hypothetical protein